MNLELILDGRFWFVAVMLFIGIRGLYEWWTARPRADKLKRLYALRETINEQIKAEMGACTKCPGCNQWDYENRFPTKWEEDAVGDILRTCGGCGNISQWIDGPGLMILVKPGSAEQQTTLTAPREV